MPKPLKPRKKAQPDHTHPLKGAKGKANYFAKLAQTPEGRELRKQWSKKPRKNPGRPKDTRDGYTLAQITPLREKAKAEARIIVSKIKKDFTLEDDRAEEALTTAVQIMREPGQNRDKLAAARMILDFTKVKPVSISEVSVGKAEAFLSGLLSEEEEGDPTDGQETEKGTQTPLH